MLQVSALAVSFLASLASGKNIRCPDAKYEENCVLTLESPKIRHHPQNESYQPVYPLFGLNYSNYGLRKLISGSRNDAENEIQALFNKRNLFDPGSVDDGQLHDGPDSLPPLVFPTPEDSIIPHIDLYGIPMLILSNNSLTGE